MAAKRKKTAKRVRRDRVMRLSALDINTRSACCENSSLILRHAYESSGALLKAYGLARQQRGGRRGMTTDQEQDLLRAMLVMATAGLDAMSKQLIRDALPDLLKKSERALNTFEKFIARRLTSDQDASEKSAANRFLARVLSRPSPQAQLTEEYVQDLTRGSLQSTEALT